MTAQVEEAPTSKSRLKTHIPILEWLPKYDKSWFRLDIMAAITVWALLVPEAMAYAGIAGMPPETGLYAAPLALLAYAIFGTSRQLNVGPSSTVAVLSYATVVAFAAPGSDEFIALTVALALITGIVLILFGILKLGIMADFLSKPVLGGFIVGLAISIAVGQLDKILGYEPDTPNFVPEVLGFVANLDQIQRATFVVGAVSLAALFAIEKYIRKLPAAITVVFAAIVISALLDLEQYGVHIVGEIPAGLPSLGLPEGIDLMDIIRLIPGAIAIALVGFAESVAAARSYATKYGYEIDANQEMIAIGVANAGSGLSGGFVVDGSLSKTAASDEAGAKSQMVSVLVAIMVLITVVALTPLFYSLPEATLGAVVIHAVWHLIDFKKLQRYYRIRKIDFAAALAAMLGVLLLGILEGLLLAILISLLGLLVRAKRPNHAVLGKLPHETVYRDIKNFPEAETVPGLIVFRFDDQLFFANAPEFLIAVREAVASDPSARWLLIDAEPINEIDITGMDTIQDLHGELARSGITLAIAEMKTNVMVYVIRDKLDEIIGADRFYPSIHSAVDAFLAEQEAEAQEDIQQKEAIQEGSVPDVVDQEDALNRDANQEGDPQEKRDEQGPDRADSPNGQDV